MTEYNPETGAVRQWMESYDHSGNVIRVHPKSINGQPVIGQHYPPTGKEIQLELNKLSNDLNRELSKLKDFVFQNYDPVGVSGKAMEIYNDYALQLSTFASEKLMILVAMDMGKSLSYLKMKLRVY